MTHECWREADARVSWLVNSDETVMDVPACVQHAHDTLDALMRTEVPYGLTGWISITVTRPVVQQRGRHAIQRGS